ncbi:MAG: hypothetical protein GY757_24825, partial [bacterium]|nr:hypothetical protein [bacterium]
VVRYHIKPVGTAVGCQSFPEDTEDIDNKREIAKEESKVVPEKLEITVEVRQKKDDEKSYETSDKIKAQVINNYIDNRAISYSTDAKASESALYLGEASIEDIISKLSNYIDESELRELEENHWQKIKNVKRFDDLIKISEIFIPIIDEIRANPKIHTSRRSKN